MNDAILLNNADNTATCLRDVKKGEIVTVGELKVKAKDDIKIFHKIAIKSINKSKHCYKYGNIIGVALEDIEEGAHVHVHNITSPKSLDRNIAEGGLTLIDYIRI